MKKILIVLLIAFWYSYPLNAKDYTKEFTKNIEKHDVSVEARQDTIASTFWEDVFFYSEPVADLYEAIKKGKGTAKTSQMNMAEAVLLAEPYYQSLDLVQDENAQSIINSLEQDLGLSSLGDKVKIYIIYDNEINACSLPDGRIFLNSGIFSIPDIRYEHLLGICAHEVGHFLLQHVAVQFYQTAKKEKSNNIVASIAAGVNIGANAYAASQGVNVDWNNVNDFTYALANAAFEDTKKFRFKYSRAQELEADLAALRFMENMGYGGHYYIEVLQFIKGNSLSSAYVQSDDSDHPSPEYRIDFLNFVLEHPEIKVKPPKKTLQNLKDKY